jgi:uncharacterized protein YqcC (DUF446 family)
VNLRHAQQCNASNATQEATQKPSPILVTAFQLDSWLQWLLQGVTGAGGGAIISQQRTNAARSGQNFVEVHRMNGAQARAAVLSALHRLIVNLPKEEVEAFRASFIAGALVLGFWCDAAGHGSII